MTAFDSSTVEARRKQHADIRTEVEKRLVANADNLDKAILTYSSAGLALSLGFLKDFVQVSVATASWLLYSSWALFVAAVIVTLVSFLLSQRAQHKQLEISYRYNIELNDSALSEQNVPARLTEGASYAAAISFVLALSASTLFVALNLPKAKQMATQKPERFIEGAPVPNLQQVPDTRGAPIPNIQPLPAQSPAPSPPAPAPAPAQPASPR